MINRSKNFPSELFTVFKKYALYVSLPMSLLFVQNAQATIVQFQTVMGDFQVNLYDKATPKTVANFLAYVTSDAYKNTIVHRSVPGFVIQGGGFQYPNKSPLVVIPQKPTVINEPLYANRRGTIAMAKLQSQPDSASNQWFFNLSDNNRGVLDSQEGGPGFTVFGEVMGNGMAIIDAMAGLRIFDLGLALNTIPLRNYTSADVTSGVAITDSHLVLIQNIMVLDANVDTAASLTPQKTTYTPPSPSSSGGSSGGGNLGLIGLLMLLVIALLSHNNVIRLKH